MDFRIIRPSEIDSFCFTNSCSYKEISVRNGLNLIDAIQEFAKSCITQKRKNVVTPTSVIERIFASVSNSNDMEDDILAIAHKNQ